MDNVVRVMLIGDLGNAIVFLARVSNLTSEDFDTLNSGIVDLEIVALEFINLGYCSNVLPHIVYNTLPLVSGVTLNRITRPLKSGDQFTPVVVVGEDIVTRAILTNIADVDLV